MAQLQPTHIADLAGRQSDFFGDRLMEVAEPIVERSDKALLDDCFNHSSPAVREHAAFEYVARHGHDAFPVVLRAWENEEDRSVRISLFEELTTIDRDGFREYLRHTGVAGDVEPVAVAQFGYEPEARLRVRSDEVEPFDQVIPLRISLREFIEVEPGVWKYHVFAPLQETLVAGQLYACSNVETRHRGIVLTKQLEGLHTDGSLHLENTLFRGRMAPIRDNYFAFNFHTALPVPFYPSGRIGDRSEGIVENAMVHVARSGTVLASREVTINDQPAIHAVTGGILAWGYTRPDRATFDPDGRMDQIAGLFHLGSLIDERIADYVNTYTVGTYRGTLLPDEDGVIGLNTNPSYSTLDGQIDRDRDGVADEPGVHYDTCPEIYPIEHYSSKRKR